MDVEKVTCEECLKKFYDVSTKNKHLKTVHKRNVETRKSKFIICPLCSNDRKDPLENHDFLISHLMEVHNVNIKQYSLFFRNLEEFNIWRAQENRDVDYACRRTIKRSDDEEYIYYNCNRSNLKGFQSNCQKRAIKVGGSIRIAGICPSRIFVKIFADGSVTVKFVETHVGHEDELRSKRLSKAEQAIIVQQLNAGVSNNRILQDARKQIDEDKLRRINLITRADLSYLIRKFNIDNKRDADDMIATALKIEEWNKEGKHHAFLFKKIGERHPELRDEDFAVAYMNDIMKKKLKSFSRIICIDGTHGTNRRNWDLTTVLIKDDQNMGFPVAFLLTNRLDQLVQKVFFSALKQKLKDDLHVEYIMSDDDPKYYNAWTEVMKIENAPRRLLCTWHVVKNWNIRGRSKIKKIENQLKMKVEMRKILKETEIGKFEQLRDLYFQHLEEEGELDFLMYLKNRYFQNADRVMQWAHCYRMNAGINTNMAIESLNKMLKHNKMNGKQNIRVEKLLDLLEELVDEKMWKRILNHERPNSNNYQHKVNFAAHKTAEAVTKNLVKHTECGKFEVQSSGSEKLYIISYNELCDEDCRRGYCEKCKICIHRYECSCPEYGVKTALCKHIHAVALYQRDSEFISGTSNSENMASNSEGELEIQEPTSTRINYQKELQHFLEEKNENATEFNEDLALEKYREVLIEKFR